MTWSTRELYNFSMYGWKHIQVMLWDMLGWWNLFKLKNIKIIVRLLLSKKFQTNNVLINNVLHSWFRKPKQLENLKKFQFFVLLFFFSFFWGNSFTCWINYFYQILPFLFYWFKVWFLVDLVRSIQFLKPRV